MCPEIHRHCLFLEERLFFYNIPRSPPNKICFQKLIPLSDMTYHGWHRLLDGVAHSASSGLYTIGKMPECLKKAKIQHRKREKWLVCTQSEHTWFVSLVPLALPFKRLFRVNCPSQQLLQVKLRSFEIKVSLTSLPTRCTKKSCNKPVGIF